MSKSNFSKDYSVSRESGIELLKILAMFFIVVSHVVQTISNPSSSYENADYIIKLSCATDNIQVFILSVTQYFGVLGNILFIVCSSWFLCDKTKNNKQKWLCLLFEVWTLSIIFLLFAFLLKLDIQFDVIIRCLFPVTFENNWYITCYLLFYLFYPLLNRLIQSMNQKTMFRLCFALFVLYFVISFLLVKSFFLNNLIIWFSIYFFVAYIKKYLCSYTENLKMNLIILFLGIVGHLGLLLATNCIGLHFSLFSNQMARWCVMQNPFLLFVGLSMFNIAKSFRFKNGIINYISSLSLFIYLIHENIIVRKYFRTYLMHQIYVSYGYSNILIVVLLSALFIFILSILISCIYDASVKKIITKICEFGYKKVTNTYHNFEKRIIR